jgi:hypothetical protein
MSRREDIVSCIDVTKLDKSGQITIIRVTVVKC